MTDARWKDFFDKMVETGMVAASVGIAYTTPCEVRQQGAGLDRPSSMHRQPQIGGIPQLDYHRPRDRGGWLAVAMDHATPGLGRLAGDILRQRDVFQALSCLDAAR